MPFGRTRKRMPGWKRLGIGLIIAAAALGIFLFLMTVPVRSAGRISTAHVDPDRLQAHVVKLAEEFAPRNYKRIWNLDKCADYIAGEFRSAGGGVSEQTYEVDGKIYRNVIVTFGPASEKRIVVGAHYDTCQDTPGADDNASGVAGLIELAHLLGEADLHRQVELVAYTLEEPPFFRTGQMGSARHAARAAQENITIEAMLALEMIGFFSDEPGSQRYPSFLTRMVYPDRGNFIALIGSLSDRGLAKRVKASMRGATELPVHAMCVPKGFPGIDFSDHRNYWAYDIPAIMVTDTAFLRNVQYHGSGDTETRLDYDRMARVVMGVYEAVCALTLNEG